MRFNSGFIFASTLICFSFTIKAQDFKQQTLDSVLITSTRIDLPFSENSRTISVISSEKIKTSPATNLADLLQEVAGVDIRRRGTEGTQADLYIRGGGFNQTLLLIDGIKVDDAQTGHHTMNMALPLEVIERIEIIKGPAARVFGQNAFTGAVNIVTKRTIENALALAAKVGSFHQKHGSITAGNQFKNSSHLVNYSRYTSDGYRNNSDYDNQTLFIKSNFDLNNLPINAIANFSERNFGAENFYTTSPNFNEYEETQASLIALYTAFKNERLTLKPRLYWRRGQDLFLLKRDDPSFFRNLHITNKIGAELNGSYNSNLGTSGFGVDLAQVYLSSNNLGQRNRFTAALFLEHRFKVLNNTLDITPGVSVNYFTDFKFHAFPGLDVGYKINSQWRVYGNVGYTYRVPTYTDLYYSDPVSVGNENLQPEKAFAQELGLKFNRPQLNVSAAVFNRDADDLIDYVSETSAGPFTATNIREVNTQGIEFNADYTFSVAGYSQNITAGYTYLEEVFKDDPVSFTRYSINSLKHHATATLRSKFFNAINQSIVYKYAQRQQGDSYTVVDANISITYNALEFRITANNIFNADYVESGFVPMPKGNLLFAVTYALK